MYLEYLHMIILMYIEIQYLIEKQKKSWRKNVNLRKPNFNLWFIPGRMEIAAVFLK